MPTHVDHPDQSVRLLEALMVSSGRGRQFKIHACSSLKEKPKPPFVWNFEKKVNSDFHIIFAAECKGAYFLGNRTEKMERGSIILISSSY